MFPSMHWYKALYIVLPCVSCNWRPSVNSRQITLPLSFVAQSYQWSKWNHSAILGESDLINLSFSCPAGWPEQPGHVPCVCVSARCISIASAVLSWIKLNERSLTLIQWKRVRVHLIRSDNLYWIKWPPSQCGTAVWRHFRLLGAAVLCFISGWRRRACMCERKTKPMSWQHNINESQNFMEQRGLGGKSSRAGGLTWFLLFASAQSWDAAAMRTSNKSDRERVERGWMPSKKLAFFICYQNKCLPASKTIFPEINERWSRDGWRP